MKRPSILLLAAFAALTLGLSDLADARRMGGGRSLGAQRESVTPSRPAPAATTPSGSTATQPQPAAPAAGATNAAPGAAPTPAPSGASRWLGPIAGLAAGLGLAALMSHLGMSEGFGSLLLIGLMVVAAIFLLRRFLGRRQTAGPMQYAGASPSNEAPVTYEAQPLPAWRGAEKIEALTAAEPAPPAFGVVRKPLPEGFDAEGFAKEAKRQYVEIQRSYDNADREALSSVMTSEMNAEIGREIDERGRNHPTEIVTLDAEVLDVTTEGNKYWASVRFTGLLREDGEPLPKSVDEIWNLTKPVNGSSGWLLAGISQLA
jgi:predicted lipid-binding transport protein (Tim44 family)